MGIVDYAIERKEKRNQDWDRIVQDNPRLNDPYIKDQFLKTGSIPTEGAPTGNELRVTSADKTEAGGDASGKGASVQFPTTEVSPETGKVVFGKQAPIAGQYDTSGKFLRFEQPPAGQEFQVVSAGDKEERLGGDQIKALESGDVASIASAFPQGVPAKVMEQFLKLKELNANKSGASDTKSNAEQDKLEQEFRQGMISIRGDASLHATEEKRDAAINAYNRIKEVRDSGKELNPIDYVDILGQIYKARTGTAPGEQVLSDAKQATAKGSFDKAFTYFTGEQAPATTKDIMDSLQNMAASMGSQADKLHDAYMKPHSLPPSRLRKELADRIIKEGRGLSFQEATGYQPQGNTPTVNSQAEYDALPKGSEYVDSNGRRARKK